MKTSIVRLDNIRPIQFRFDASYHLSEGEEVKRFIRACIEEKIKTTTTVVSKVPDYPIDVARCAVVAKSLGAKFREREFIENGY